MKPIASLSGLVLLTFSSIAPCFAVDQPTRYLSAPPLSNQPIRSQSEAIEVAGFGDLIRGAGSVLDRVERERRNQEQREERQRVEAERELRRQEQRAERQRREEERQRQVEAQARQQEELAAARRAATEEQRLEADRRRRYFDSLSPADQATYLAEQRALAEQQAQRDTAALLLLMSVADAMSGPDVVLIER
jgi:hypothetical protein